MEDEKMQRLHDVLSKLSRKGKTGGLGSGSGFGSGSRTKDPTVPDNALYARFVRAGTGHKRKFGEEEADEEEDLRKEKKSSKSSTAASGAAAEAEMRELVLMRLRAANNQPSKELQVHVCAQFSIQEDSKALKKLYKSVVNALVDADTLCVTEDGAIALFAEVKKEKKEKKEKKDKKDKKDKKEVAEVEVKKEKKEKKSKKDKK